jgi:hypothetical protein
MIKLTLMIILAIFLIGFIGCEGPKGPAGPAGPAGIDGVDGVDGVDGADGTDISGAQCLVCHADDRLLEKRFQLNQHDHSSLPNSLSRGTSATCGRCHSHEGFVELLDTGGSNERESATPLTCKTCHTLHNGPDAEDFSFGLRVEGPVVFLTGNIETFGEGAPANTCIQCHQPRRDYTNYDDTPSDASDDVTVTSSHAGPHYGITGSLIFGKGADDRNGSSPLNQGPMLHASAGCVTCHMGESRKHTFEPEVENCQMCHSGAEDFDMNGAVTKMEAAIHAIATEFVDLGFLETTDHVHFEATASRGSPNVLTGTQFTAFWNYQVIHADHGSVYHNPPYVKAIINNIEENLGLTQTTW